MKAEAAEANKAAAANAKMKDFSVTVTQFAHDDVAVKIMTKIPESGWSYDEGKKCLVENDDPTAFGAGAIRFEVRANVEDFDYYKDDFENYQDIDDRVIGGITFKGRTYKHIGYDWIEYVAQIDDGRALSIGLTDIGLRPGHDARRHPQRHDDQVSSSVSIYCLTTAYQTAPARSAGGRFLVRKRKRWNHLCQHR